ncbi:uncharacterized protein YALI1_F15367g [Yarrowia lipolytica]|uniref:Secreted protein n=1 Tax=Yarrowia lipolytica TaxID=4952 RepID=A0A1D8NMY8_YARLL|nr:hypothetical protein YALI1_F15367g [Yarrowia lipolytica]
MLMLHLCRSCFFLSRGIQARDPGAGKLSTPELAGVATSLLLQLASPRVQVGHVHLGALAGVLVEDGTAVFGSPGRGVKMQRDSHLGFAGVFDSMQADFVGHVGHLLLGSNRLLDDLHGALDTFLGPLVESLHQVALEDLHDAVGVGVVMDARALSGVPNQQKQVGLVVDVVHSVSGVSSSGFFQSKVLPLGLDGVVPGHDVHEVFDVDVIGINAGRRAQNCSDALLEHFKPRLSLVFGGRHRKLSENLLRARQRNARRQLLSALFQPRLLLSRRRHFVQHIVG